MIKFENVSVTYPGGVEALKDLDLEINEGDFLIIVGLSGAGKSTTGQLLAKESGYVYYEADCMINCLNPFLPLDTNDTHIMFYKERL